MPANGDTGEALTPRQRMRPAPVGHAWAWIVLAVAIVIFMVLTLWFTQVVESAEDAGQVSDRETVHRLGQRMRARWPQVPGPPAIYLEQAEVAFRTGDHQRAIQRIGMTLALDPDDVDAWMWLAVMSCQRPMPEGALTEDEVGALALAIGQTHPRHSVLPVALGWLALRRGAPDRALASVGIKPDSLVGRLLRLEARGSEATKADVSAVLELAPAHSWSCRIGADLLRQDEGLDSAVALLVACVDAGADETVRDQLARLRAASLESAPESLDSTTVAD